MLYPSGFGIFCFYIILKLPITARCSCLGLVSSAFTSFSNSPVNFICIGGVWYLLLLHHSQTSPGCSIHNRKFGTFCFYIILKQLLMVDCLTPTFGTFCFCIILKHLFKLCCKYICLVPSAFTSFSNIFRCLMLLEAGLVSSAFTSFSNSFKSASSIPSGLVPSAFTSFSNKY